jgi:amino acid transporter
MELPSGTEPARVARGRRDTRRPRGAEPAGAQARREAPAAGPRETLTVTDLVAVIVGVVVGAGIFRTPSLVAANAGSAGAALLAWALGGAISIVGALSYAELAGTYPDSGGDYHYLGRAFGGRLAFLFVWARLMVIQTGSIALQAFLIGDYASALLRLGPHSSALYAAAAAVALTAVNLAGLRRSRWIQNALTAAIVLGLLVVTAVGLGGALFGAAPAEAPAAATPGPLPGPSGSFGVAMIFVLLTYGGWNEAAYLSAELRGGAVRVRRALLVGLGAVTALYLLANVAVLQGLGFERVARSDAVMAELLRGGVGRAGAGLLALLVVVAALSTMNATIVTGARSGYALGRDCPRLAFLGRWHAGSDTPAAALWAQLGVTLVLVLLGALTRQGFATMVEYTAPVFWLFFLLVGVALFVLRRKDRAIPRVLPVPLYPWTPLLFCAVAACMLVASVAHTGTGALVGVAVLALGAPFAILMRGKERSEVRGEGGAG